MGMHSISQHYDDLNRAIDDVRGLLDEWLAEFGEDPMSTWAANTSSERPDGTSFRKHAKDTGPDSASSESSSSRPIPSESSNGTSLPDEDQGRPSVVRYVQVVLHEWLANLIQHADFGSESPTVEIRIYAHERYISCAVDDNSHGFDLQEQLVKQRQEARVLPERGMGLRIINACTDRCTYHSTDAGCHRFEFSIPVDHDPWLSMLF
ncbi:hypothetical protein CRI94_03200 [Longibacter salinarum]|uniref:Histidine kinase/HSP90-like ATPase domain-containing protein n=1 Tax=Longibacter salinarum TaxID=1850348 RepID=A0A2A8D378_9BACT|nr:ATP-binding protein [Longibacter salinarum]PEN15412.1 hypothetical protein CRI94_03200 [Longibacter salinarum]